MPLAAVRLFVRNTLEDWRSIHVADLHFWHRSDARLTLIGLVAVILLLVVGRSLLSRRPGRQNVVVPALLASVRSSIPSAVRHVPALLFLAGLLFFGVALADPYTSLVSSEVSYPGRRISIMIDASTSMRTPFKAEHLNRRAATDATFFTSVAAAERFVQMRIKGRYRDLLALVEFGNEAYVVTPFTNDYDNILLSISLIGDPVEYSLFPDQGTIIAQAIDQSVGLFKAFDFLDASGNIMVLFTDGEDTRAVINGRTLDDIVQSTIQARIPVYMVRTNYSRGRGRVIPDELWIPAVEKTGGRFYAADSEETLLAAIRDIDAVATGTIQTRQYSSQRPRFGMFAFLAAACWLGSAGLKLGVPVFQKLP
jgi:hypothetical protein